METKNEKILVPVNEIEVKTKQVEMSLGVGSKSLKPPRPDLSGLRLMHLTGSAIYLVNPEGYLQWIPDPPTYNNLFRDWSGVYRVDIATMPISTPLTSGAVLAKGNLSGKVYIISNGKKRWIVSPAAMDKYWFNWSHIYVVPQILIDSIPSGSNWF